MRVPDGRNGFAHDLLEVDVSVRRDLSRHDYEAGAGERFAGYAAHGILRQAGVQDGVGNLIGNLVRMALGHRLTGKQKTVAFRQNALLKN